LRAEAHKVTNKTVNNSTVLTNDNELTWPMQVNTAYALDAHIRYQTNTAADAKIGWSYPAGAQMGWNLIANDASLVATITGDYNESANPALGGNVVITWAHAAGIIVTGGTAGALTLQFAQNTANASDTILIGYSYGFLTRLS
jgi:hypothetical protein